MGRARKKKRRKPRRWIKAAHLKRGALHRALGYEAGEKIPRRVLEACSGLPGKTGKRCRLALTLEDLKRAHG